LTLLLVGSYKKFNTNEYVELLADAYMKKGIQVIFEEQNFLYSNFIPHIIHIQWPESIYRWKNLIPMTNEGLEIFENKLKWYKGKCTKLVYTVHNLQPHDVANEFDHSAYTIFLKYADIIVHHGNESIELIKRKYPETITSNHIIAPHGSYPIKKLPEIEQVKDKYDLPKNKIIFTNFGLQRSYKGIDFTLNVFKQLLNKNICYFTVGALINGAQPFEISQDELCHRQIYKSIPPNEITDIIASTDVFFLGHSSGLNSGLIHLAISYNKPVIFPNIGNFEEQAKGFNFYEMYEVGNIESAQQAINRMLVKLNHCENNLPDNKLWLNKNAWNIHIDRILKEIQKLLNI
jgi:hypothetical protein